MQKLYLKLIFAIWAVMLISAMTVVLVINATTSGEDGRNMAPAALLSTMAKRATRDADGLGQAGLVAWFEADPMIARFFNFRLSTVDGEVLLASTVSVQRTPPRGGWRQGADGQTPFAERQIATYSHEFGFDEGQYVISAQMPRHPPVGRPGGMQRAAASFIFLAQYRWLLLLIAVAVSAVLSLMIARYLVRPLRTFEEAGQQLAKGNFAVRVAPALGNRGDEIAAFAGTFDQMAVRIQALLEAHKSLLRDVSHELRSPLARALAAVSLAKQRQGNPDVNPELDLIEREIGKLSDMIGKLLAFSKLDARRAEFAKELVWVDQLLATIVADSNVAVRATGKHINLELEDSLGVYGNEELLASAFENVLSNAIRYTPEGSSVEISSRASADADHLCVEIRDHGSGVAEDELQRIFDPFYRVDEGRATHTGGTGIGLSIARKAIEWHGGTLSARNAEENGLIVTIDLPRRS